MPKMLAAGSGSLFMICRFSENSKFQQRCWLQNVSFQTSGVAFDNGLSDILGYSQEKQFTGHFNISGSEETDKSAVVLQLPEGTLCLNRTVYPQQFSFLRCNSFQRRFPKLNKFPTDNKLFLFVRIPGFAAGCSVRTLAAILTPVSCNFPCRPVFVVLC